MQLVLDDQIGRIERPAISEWPTFAWFSSTIETNTLFEAVNMTEESPGFADLRQCSELVDSGDQKRWQAAVDWFINGKNWKRSVSAELTTRINAADFEIGWCMHVRCTRKGRRLEFGATPGASFEWCGCAFIASTLVTSHATDSGCFVGFAFAAQFVR